MKKTVTCVNLQLLLCLLSKAVTQNNRSLFTAEIQDKTVLIFSCREQCIVFLRLTSSVFKILKICRLRHTYEELCCIAPAILITKSVLLRTTYIFEMVIILTGCAFRLSED